VEFALVIPVALMLLLSLFDLGRAVYAYTTVSNAAREGARRAIVDQTSTSGVYAAQTEAAESATALGIAPASVTVSFLAPDLSGPCPTRDLGCVAVVTVPYQYTPATPIVNILVGEIHLSSTVRIPIERTYP
jgi:Flp pilus assembly protein TadG